MDRDQIINYLEESLRKHKGSLRNGDFKRVSRQIRERKKFGIIANLSYCRYELVRKTVEEAGFTIKDDEDLSDAFLVWTDNFLPLEKIMSLKSHQRLNHFPGMIEICRKDFLAKNFVRMNRIEPVEYSFMPKTWVLPQEHGFLLNYAQRAINRGTKPTFIMKPANGAMGHGIRLYRNAESVPVNPMNGTPCVIQEYINNPLLIDGYKCDLRVYVLVTSCDPLRIYIYNDGLVRLGAEKYADPSAPDGESMFRHLTNYAVNKHHAQYNRNPNEMIGSKRSFCFLDQYLRNTRKVDPLSIWRSIRELIVKTVAIAEPHLLHSYRMCRRGRNQVGRAYSLETMARTQRSVGTNRVKRAASHSNKSIPAGTTPKAIANGRLANESGMYSGDAARRSQPRASVKASSQVTSRGIAHFLPSNFFEILGFDILLDDELKPWLIEVNRSPSFNGDQQLDQRVKHGLLTDTLRLLNIRPSDKEAAEKEQRLISYRRLYTKPSVSSSTSSASDYQKNSNRNSTTAPSSRNQPRQPEDVTRCAVDQQIWKLQQQLLLIRQQLQLEFFEYHNCGNWSLLFPTEDPVAQKRFASFILKNFSQFHNGKGGDLQKEMEATYLYPVTEDEILNQLNNLKKLSTNSPFDQDVDQDSDSYRTDLHRYSSDDDESLSSQVREMKLRNACTPIPITPPTRPESCTQRSSSDDDDMPIISQGERASQAVTSRRPSQHRIRNMQAVDSIIQTRSGVRFTDLSPMPPAPGLMGTG